MSGEDDLPSWDEFGAEQLDYGEENEEEESQQLQHVAAPTGDDPGDPGEEPSTSAATVAAPMRGNARVAAVRTTSGSSSSSSRAAPAAAAAPRHIGPSLPPGFDLGGGAGGADDDDDDEDPEDPGDPGEPTVDEAELAPTLPSMGGPSLPIDDPTTPGDASAPAAPSARDAAAAGPAPPPEPLPVQRQRRTNVARTSRAKVARPAQGPSSRVIGPAIPSDFLPFEANGGEEEDSDASLNDDDRVDEPPMSESDEQEEEEVEEDAFGPALPPRMNGGAAAAAGAAPSPGMEMPMLDEEDDDEVIGPMPARSAADDLAAEARRAQLRAEKEAEGKKLKREEWMLQLPKKLTSYGLGPRSFSKSNGAGGDSSAWTTGPGTSAATDPEETKAAMEKLATAERDSAQARIASTLNVGRNESMLDSHSRKRKAGEDAVAGPSAPTVRRAFDIEKDMQVRGLKSASTEEIKEKCGHLSSRFSNSGSAKFL